MQVCCAILEQALLPITALKLKHLCARVSS